MIIVGVLEHPEWISHGHHDCCHYQYISSIFTRYPGIDPMGHPMRKQATRETTGPLKAWLGEHRKNPYPTKAEKIMLAIITRMTLTQVRTRGFPILSTSFNIAKSFFSCLFFCVWKMPPSPALSYKGVKLILCITCIEFNKMDDWTREKRFGTIQCHISPKVLWTDRL